MTITKETRHKLVVAAEWALIIVGLPLIVINLAVNKTRDLIEGE